MSVLAHLLLLPWTLLGSQDVSCPKPHALRSAAKRADQDGLDRDPARSIAGLEALRGRGGGPCLEFFVGEAVLSWQPMAHASLTDTPAHFMPGPPTPIVLLSLFEGQGAFATSPPTTGHWAEREMIAHAALRCSFPSYPVVLVEGMPLLLDLDGCVPIPESETDHSIFSTPQSDFVDWARRARLREAPLSIPERPFAVTARFLEEHRVAWGERCDRRRLAYSSLGARLLAQVYRAFAPWIGEEAELLGVGPWIAPNGVAEHVEALDIMVAAHGLRWNAGTRFFCRHDQLESWEGAPRADACSALILERYSSEGGKPRELTLSSCGLFRVVPSEFTLRGAWGGRMPSDLASSLFEEYRAQARTLGLQPGHNNYSYGIMDIGAEVLTLRSSGPDICVWNNWFGSEAGADLDACWSRVVEKWPDRADDLKPHRSLSGFAQRVERAVNRAR